MPSEFDLIKHYFTRPAKRTVLGVGDDAALVRVAEGKELVVAADMLLAGRHFFHEDDAFGVGHKSLAVNLSDMAAMGATPRWALLSIALPEADERWIKGFSQGLFELADAHGVALIGGDTTKGPLTISVTIMGEVERGKALRRSGAKAGDDIWVSGTLGDAALALAHLKRGIVLAPHDAAALLPRLHQPTPRVKLGQKLSGSAHAAIDISDGLLADLGHILEASNVGAAIDVGALPVSAPLRGYLEHDAARQAVLAGGDDYELCFTAAPKQRAEIEALGRRLKLNLTRIGKIMRKKGLALHDAQGRPVTWEHKGFDHFA
jgi:thiamine-monophosphate kinase